MWVILFDTCAHDHNTFPEGERLENSRLLHKDLPDLDEDLIISSLCFGRSDECSVTASSPTQVAVRDEIKVI